MTVAGLSKYRFLRRVRLAFDAVTSLSERPLLGARRHDHRLASGVALWLLAGTLLNPDGGRAGYGSPRVLDLALGAFKC
jgi:hypothetical protein